MTVRVNADKTTGIAVVTLDRPERLNAINLPMRDELRRIWRELRFDDSVRAVVLTGSGERAFCTGLDRDAEVPQPGSPYMADDPLLRVGPKSNDLWKPVVAAVRGMACGGAFYLLGESDFLVADTDATFFDPHTTYGMVSAYESVLMAHRMPHGEVARMMLMGTAERIGARRAYDIGLVSELTDPGGALAAATACATVIAGYPPEGVQGTVRALWAAKEAALAAGFAQAPHLISLGNLPAHRQAELFAVRRGGGSGCGEAAGQLLVARADSSTSQWSTEATRLALPTCTFAVAVSFAGTSTSANPVTRYSSRLSLKVTLTEKVAATAFGLVTSTVAYGAVALAQRTSFTVASCSDAVVDEVPPEPPDEPDEPLEE